MAPQDPCAPRVVLHMCACSPSPRPQVPVCTPALHIPVTGECVDEQTGLGNGCFGSLGSWTPSLDRRP